MGKAKGVKGTLVLLALILMMIGYYFYLANRNTPVEEDVQLTQTQEVLTRNISLNYPASPKEVVKYFSELTQCFYSGECSEDELKGLANRQLELFDDELEGFQSPEDYSRNLKLDIQKFRDENLVVSSYKVANSTDVIYFNKDNHECAGVLVTYTIRQGTKLQATEELVVLRKDTGGHWKIFGWTVADDEIKKKIQGIDG